MLFQERILVGLSLELAPIILTNSVGWENGAAIIDCNLAERFALFQRE